MSNFASARLDKHVTHHWHTRSVVNCPTMPTSREILAANLKRIIAADSAKHPTDRPGVRGWAKRKELNVRLIDRLVKRQHAVTLDNLELIAAACGLQAWHPLIEDLDPRDPPDRPITAEDLAMISKLRRLLGN